MAVRPYQIIDVAYTPDDIELTLCERGPELVIRQHGIDLMSNRMFGSEQEMAALAGFSRPGSEVLVGGLGMGFTLRAVLDMLPERGRVTVCELMQAVVTWNEGRLGPIAGHPLKDPRASLIVADVGDVLRRWPGRWDAILLDVDNGPQAFTQEANESLYTVRGMNIARSALAPRGTLAVWSAFEDREFQRRMGKAGFVVEAHQVRGRGVDRGPWHWVYVGRT
jgi:spermidine synthase